MARQSTSIGRVGKGVETMVSWMSSSRGLLSPPPSGPLDGCCSSSHLGLEANREGVGRLDPARPRPNLGGGASNPSSSSSCSPSGPSLSVTPSYRLPPRPPLAPFEGDPPLNGEGTLSSASSSLLLDRIPPSNPPVDRFVVFRLKEMGSTPRFEVEAMGSSGGLTSGSE